MARNTFRIRVITITAVSLALAVQTAVFGQMAGWKVYVKTSPCSERSDWVTVAQENPTGKGGSNYWETADLVTGNTNCGRLNSRCTKAEADAEAVTVRASPRFSDYCCKDYSIWRNSQTNRLSIVLGKFGTAGLGWMFEDGPMCCDQAERLTGLTGTCTGVIGGKKPRYQADHAHTGKNLTYYQRQTVEQCEADCNNNARCKGYTWIQPGTYSQGDPAMCYLMELVTGTNPSRGHHSGMKSNAATEQPPNAGGANAGIELSGAWTSTKKDSSGYTVRYEMTLKRSAANEFSGNLITIQVDAPILYDGKKVSSPQPIKIALRENGAADLWAYGYKYEAAYTKASLTWQNITFSRK